MTLDVVIEQQVVTIPIPEEVLREGEEFFSAMDRDMDRGWQMSREWVEHPTQMQRCQIAADKLYDAMETGNDILVKLMAGYILTRMPNIARVCINTEGEMGETELVLKPL